MRQNTNKVSNTQPKASQRRRRSNYAHLMMLCLSCLFIVMMFLSVSTAAPLKRNWNLTEHKSILNIAKSKEVSRNESKAHEGTVSIRKQELQKLARLTKGKTRKLRANISHKKRMKLVPRRYKLKKRHKQLLRTKRKKERLYQRVKGKQFNDSLASPSLWQKTPQGFHVETVDLQESPSHLSQFNRDHDLDPLDYNLLSAYGPQLEQIHSTLVIFAFLVVFPCFSMGCYMFCISMHQMLTSILTMREKEEIETEAKLKYDCCKANVAPILTPLPTDFYFNHKCGRNCTGPKTKTRKTVKSAESQEETKKKALEMIKVTRSESSTNERVEEIFGESAVDIDDIRPIRLMDIFGQEENAEGEDPYIFCLRIKRSLAAKAEEIQQENLISEEESQPNKERPSQKKNETTNKDERKMTTDGSPPRKPKSGEAESSQKRSKYSTESPKPNRKDESVTSIGMRPNLVKGSKQEVSETPSIAMARISETEKMEDTTYNQNASYIKQPVQQENMIETTEQILSTFKENGKKSKLDQARHKKSKIDKTKEKQSKLDKTKEKQHKLDQTKEKNYVKYKQPTPTTKVKKTFKKKSTKRGSKGNIWNFFPLSMPKASCRKKPTSVRKKSVITKPTRSSKRLCLTNNTPTLNKTKQATDATTKTSKHSDFSNKLASTSQELKKLNNSNTTISEYSQARTEQRSTGDNSLPDMQLNKKPDTRSD